MTEKILTELREIESLNRVIIGSISLIKAENLVEVELITDKPYSNGDLLFAGKIIRKYVPYYFACKLSITKLSPDEDMVAKKIFAIINENNRQLAALITQDDISVEKTQNGFFFTLTVIRTSAYSLEVAKQISKELGKCFCGEFSGVCKESSSKIDDIVIEKKHTNVSYEIPTRYFDIYDFNPLEGKGNPTKAVYIADLNFVADKVVVCGEITAINERTYQNSRVGESRLINFAINDKTASKRFTYFCRKKTPNEVYELKVGDSVVLTCKTELFEGDARATVLSIDYGKLPENFVPEKRQSKPVPKYYETIFPEKYVDYTQDDFFTDNSLPEFITSNQFVVFDLETTGLNRSPSTGNMDRIIELGALKLVNGEITESFSTFVDPKRKISEEIVKLTGIEQSMIDGAPEYEAVMPDFFKFIDGCYLVGHNVCDFDFKFVDYYLNVCGYVPERKLIDTLTLAQERLRLSNYKLNTIADYFGIKFNHHRALDDAEATAKIFIELAKLKKSLPKLS